MSDKPNDRATILRRRAFFVTSAVAALGSCARTTTPPAPAAPSVVSVPAADPDAGEPETDAALPSPADAATHSDAPPLDVPAGVSETARQKYERLASVMTRAYRILDEIDAELPNCSILDASCEPRFRKIADKLHELDGAFSASVRLRRLVSRGQDVRRARAGAPGPLPETACTRASGDRRLARTGR